ncbi:MAG: hypothetical protein HZY76_13755 [Anaerolineae bacterium]|nr:MAG: hypothetical protein HZY76_13755 [Anaerolineae bacterium]
MHMTELVDTLSEVLDRRVGNRGVVMGRIVGARWRRAGYNSSAFHLERSGASALTVCAMCALEANSISEQLAFAAMDLVFVE